MRYTLVTIISAFILLASCTPQESKDIFDIPQEGYTLFETDFEDLTIAGTTAEMILSYTNMVKTHPFRSLIRQL